MRAVQKTMSRSVLLGAVMLGAACAASDARLRDLDPATAAAATASVVGAPDRLRADVAFLSDDALAGREAGEPGYDLAADYVAARMRALGLRPGANGGWFQPVTLRTATTDNGAARMTIHHRDGARDDLTVLGDFKLYPSLNAPDVSLTAPVVFVGYGVHAPRMGHDDLAGLDLNGKIVARLSGAPASFESEARAYFGSSETKRKDYAARGAVGVISLYTEASEQRFSWERASRNPVANFTGWVGPDDDLASRGSGVLASVLLSPDAADDLFRGAEKSYDAVREEAARDGVSPRGFDLPATVTLRGRSVADTRTSANVVGVIEGADPQLKNEALVITAHLDHVGVNAGRKGDRINNGAIDNALGVAMLLETARRFVEGPAPRRTIVFLAVTAEEKGLLGADYYAHYPTPGDKAIIANVNLDMPVMLHDFTDLIAYGAERSSLGPTARAALAEAGVALSPDPMPEQGIFTRSDHYPFVKKGVPAIFLWPGFANGGEAAINDFLANHYHRPSDEIDLPIRWGQAARFADLNYRITRKIVDADARPTWNSGDFFGDEFAGADRP